MPPFIQKRVLPVDCGDVSEGAARFRDAMMFRTPAETALPELVLGPQRVLVVDEEPLIRWSLCAALAAEGFHAVPTADLAGACRLAAELLPRVVLFDLRAPDRDGLAALSDMRRVHPDCRFIIMTTARNCALRYAFNDGVQLIEKPFDLARVVRLVRELADRATA